MFQKGLSGNPTGKRREKLFRDALMMELRKAGEDMKDLRDVARALIDKAKTGDIPAVKEFGDRIDGKIPQANIMMGDEDGGPMRYQQVERVIVDPGEAANTNSESVQGLSSTG